MLNHWNHNLGFPICRLCSLCIEIELTAVALVALDPAVIATSGILCIAVFKCLGLAVVDKVDLMIGNVIIVRVIFRNSYLCGINLMSVNDSLEDIITGNELVET